jgi:hypothetical protein
VRILIVSGIWPPDVGGPASHAPEAADELRRRGHTVEVVVTADAAPGERPYPVHWVSRRIPIGLRHLETARLARARRSPARTPAASVSRVQSRLPATAED